MCIRDSYSLGVSKAERETDAILKWLHQVREIAEFRNTVVHTFWHVDGEGKAYAVRFQARGEFKRIRRPISDEEIQRKTDEAHELASTLRQLRDHLNQRPPPSRQEVAQKQNGDD